MKRLLGIGLIGLCISLMVGCTSTSSEALELSVNKPSFLFFYTEF